MVKRVFVYPFACLLLLLTPQYVSNADTGLPISNMYELNEAEKANKEWAEKVRAGGFILHFRHAQRELWSDVFTFDAIELIDGVDASKESYKRATCLTSQGKEEAKALGKTLRISSVRVSQVISSPSCRARQTASLTFGKITRIDNSLLHRSAIPKVQHQIFDLALRKLLLDVPLKKGKNVALVGHVDTLVYRGNSVLDLENGVEIPVETREFTGFVVLERVGNQVFARHVFKSMKDFSLATLLLPEPRL